LRPSQGRSASVSNDAYIDVSVATVWRQPSSVTPADAPALRNPVDVAGWLAALGVSGRRSLVGRVDTQALYGERVVMLARSGEWARVVVPDQPTPLDSRGYPGWVPFAQLTTHVPLRTALTATVVVPLASALDAAGRPAIQLSFGTRLPLLGKVPGWDLVATPGGGQLRLPSSSVALAANSAPALAASAADVVRTARLFLGLAYLWGGTSGYGLDCSGLVHLVYAAHGIVIPRDADAQAGVGQAVPAGSLQPGDLLFFASAGFVHHVAMYVGNGLMLQSPQTGSVVSIVSFAGSPLASEFAGARRFLAAP
jgi:cell wall-associated NlpC family hydrolase